MADEQSYEELLNEAYKNIKPVTSKIDRFEVPKAEGHIEGNKTIITNFRQIAGYLRRDASHLLKYLLKEIAAPGSMKGDNLVLTRKIPSRQINEKIQQYAKNFVICNECKKPDTEIIKESRFAFIHCMACGAKKPITKP